MLCQGKTQYEAVREMMDTLITTNMRLELLTPSLLPKHSGSVLT